MVKVYGDLDYSLLKHLYDKIFIYATFLSAIFEAIFYNLQINN